MKNLTIIFLLIALSLALYHNKWGEVYIIKRNGIIEKMERNYNGTLILPEDFCPTPSTLKR